MSSQESEEVAALKQQLGELEITNYELGLENDTHRTLNRHAVRKVATVMVENATLEIERDSLEYEVAALRKQNLDLFCRNLVLRTIPPQQWTKK